MHAVSVTNNLIIEVIRMCLLMLLYHHASIIATLSTLVCLRFCLGDCKEFKIHSLVQLCHPCVALITLHWRALHWLPVEKRIDFKIAVLTFKVLRNDRPLYLASLVSRYVPTRLLRSADKETLVMPNIKSANGRRSFSFSAPTIWNSLPLEMRSITSFPVFRKKLKHHLFPP